MSSKSNVFWLVAGMAIACAPLAQAGAPTSRDKKAKIEKLVNNQRSFQQPRTMAQAEATQVKLPDGTVQVAVPTELWTTLSVQKGADGKLKVMEADGTGAATAAVALDR